MSAVLTDDSHYSAIADAIRAKNGLSGAYRPSEMAGAIAALQTGGGGFGPLLTGAATAVADSSVSALRSYALQGMQSLASVDLPACASLGENAFYDCPSLSDVRLPACERVGPGAFVRNGALSSISLPSCASIGSNAFQYCGTLASANLPACEVVASYAFYYCEALSEVSLPSCASIGRYAFAYCSALTRATLPACWTIAGNAFQGCLTLMSLDMTGASRVPSIDPTTFASTPIGGYSAATGALGTVYVPSSLYSDFIGYVNWSVLSSRIVSA